MHDWQYDDHQIVSVGIDIGWSNRRRSCALAVEGLLSPGLPQWRTFAGNGRRPISVGLFRYDELLNALPGLLAPLRESSRQSVVVIDGPTGPRGAPANNRHVDSAFTRGNFNRRMQPVPVAGNDGGTYVEKTDHLRLAIYEALQVQAQPAWWNGKRIQHITICETNPTVGLALLLPPADVATLPSRKRPRLLNARWIRAKSDWYWQMGAGNWIAKQVFGFPQVAQERNHERVAGLYCLAVAHLLAQNNNHVVAVGESDGVYVIPSVVDQRWRADLEAVGILHGQLDAQDQVVAAQEIAPVAPPKDEIFNSEEPDAADSGDDVTLILNDNGIIWECHNDWLEGEDGPLCAMSVDGFEDAIRLDRAAANGQWRLTGKDSTALNLARRRGFEGQHLANDCAVRILIRVVRCPE